MPEESDALAIYLQRLSRDRADQDAWTALYERVWGLVLAIAYRTLRGIAAEDAAQEVFVRVARYCPFQRLQTADSFRAYLRRVTLNECFSRLKKQKRAAIVDGDGSDAPEPHVDPSGEFEWRELYEWAVDELTQTDQDILRLTDEGFGGEEIAKQLGLTAGTVAVRRHRARDVVRKFLKSNGLLG